MPSYTDLKETKFADMATKAANDFLNPPHMPLNESIRKQAIDNDLNPEEIARVVEAANKEVYLTAFPQMDSKVFEFKVASAKEICEDLGRSLPKYAEEKGSWKFCTVIDNTEKTASEKAAERLDEIRAMVGTEEQICWRALDKARLKKQAAEQEVQRVRDEMRQTIADFIKDAKQRALDGQNLYAAGLGLAERYPEQKEVIAAMIDTALEEAEILENEKIAAPVANKWINEAMDISGVPVKVINGKHSLCYHIDLLVDQSRTLEGCQQGLWRSHDEVDFVRRNLKNSVGLEISKESPEKETRFADPEPSKEELIKHYLTYGE